MLTILATSREGLAVEGERLFALRSLEVPKADVAVDLSAAASSDAVRLFIERGQAVHSGFSLTADNVEAVAEICRRLDGIPLALELAAARLQILSVDQILSKLDDRFRLLTGGHRTALPRHQTLRATLQWSYDQLTAEEQSLLALLSVFSGGWTLDRAARVAEIDELEMMDLLERLVEKSLVVVDREGEESRYGYLETVRQFASELLESSGDAEAVRARHLDELLSLAEEAYAARLTAKRRGRPPSRWSTKTCARLWRWPVTPSQLAASSWRECWHGSGSLIRSTSRRATTISWLPWVPPRASRIKVLERARSGARRTSEPGWEMQAAGCR